MVTHRRPQLVLVGAVFGLAWSAALRGFMMEAAGEASTFSWFGTFGAILLPGATVGGLFGWAEHLRRTGGLRGRRKLALARSPSPFSTRPR